MGKHNNEHVGKIDRGCTEPVHPPPQSVCHDNRRTHTHTQKLGKKPGRTEWARGWPRTRADIEKLGSPERRGEENGQNSVNIPPIGKTI